MVRWNGLGINDTFNNISVISWRSVLLIEETGVPAENHPPAANRWQILSHNVVSSTPRQGDSNSEQLIVVNPTIDRDHDGPNTGMGQLFLAFKCMIGSWIFDFNISMDVKRHYSAKKKSSITTWESFSFILSRVQLNLPNVIPSHWLGPHMSFLLSVLTRTNIYFVFIFSIVHVL